MLFILNKKFRKVAMEEPKKYFHRYFLSDARRLVINLPHRAIVAADKVGIRPQLVDWNKKELVNDFIVLKHKNSIHMLNTISPAFTSSLAFAEMVVNKYL